MRGEGLLLDRRGSSRDSSVIGYKLLNIFCIKLCNKWLLLDIYLAVD